MSLRRAHGLLRSTLLALLAAAFVAGLFVPGRGVRADGALQVNGTPSVQNSFPAEAVFSVDATSTATITDVTLHYSLLPEDNQVSARADFDQGTTVHATYHLRTAGNPLYVPPMKTLRYYWTLQDASGNQAQTQPTDWTYQDTRFTFKTATNGNLTLFYHAGSDADAQRVLGIGRQAIDKAQALDGVTVDFPVRVVAYANQAELGAALQHVSRSFDPNVLGQAVPPDTVILAVGNLTGSENDDTFRHELTHIVNARAVKGGFSDSFPIWLDEGLAVNAQNDPGGFRPVIQQAISANQVVPVRTLTPGFEGAQTDLFYAESWSVVHFLVGTYGPEKLAKLLAAFKSGSTDDQAFTQAYGFDRDGLYNAWRQSVGLPAVKSAPQAQPSTAAQAQPSSAAASGGQAAAPSTVPTIPAAAPAPRTAQPASSSDNTTPIVVGVAVGIAALALLVVAVVGGLMLSRRGQGRL